LKTKKEQIMKKEVITKIVGFIGSQEICRYSLRTDRELDIEQTLENVWRQYPHLKNDTARIYVNGTPIPRRFMGQFVIDVGNE